MACLLEKGDILDVYSDIYESILSRINGSIKTKFSPEQYIKDFHNEIAESNDPKFALEVAQAIPEIMLQVIATRKNIREYFVKNNISQDPILKMSLSFEDFNAIKIFVSGQKKSLDEQKQKIIRKNKSKENIEILDPTDTTINYSNVQKKGKVEDPLTNSGQFAIAYNPDEVTKEEQDTPDPEKEMFYTVIKQIILISEQKPTDTDEVIYQGVSLAQRPVSIKNFPTKPDGTTLLVDDDVKFLEKNPDYNGLLNVITDTDGNYVYFTEKGDITNESEGRLVYQYVRDIVLKDGKLILTNRSGFAYTLVSPENIIERKNNAYKQIHTIGMLQADKDAMLKKERAQQKKRINDLYRLHTYMKENPDEAVVLRITGGSFGNFKNKYIPIAETGLKLDDINLPFIGGGKSGYIQVEIAQDLPGISVKHPIYLQRGDINEDLADKIATILTTKARYRGEELSPLAKRTYAEIFLGDNVVVRDTNKIKNNIEILTPEINGITTLTVSINDVPVYLDSPNAKEEIKKHLLAAIPNKNGQIYPANLNYSQAYIGIGKTFTDYIVSGEKITKKEVNYFDFIKPRMKIEYSAESASFFVNSNAYLSYSIPSSIMPAGKKNFDLASVTPASKRTVKAKIDNEVNEIINEDDVKVEPGKVVYNLKKVTAAYQVNANIVDTGVTLNIGTDLETGLAKIAKTKAKNYVPITLSKKAKTKKDFPNVGAVASATVKNLNRYKSDTVHAIGNNIAELTKGGYSQTDINTVVYEILDKIVNSTELIEPVTKIVTIGESGVSEAVIKAAKKLGIGVEVTVPSGWTFSVSWAKGKTGTFTISNKDEFLSRFGDAPTKTNAKRKVAKTANQYNRVAAAIAKKKATSNKIYGTRKKAPAKKTPATIKQQDAQVNTVSSMSLTERLKQKRDIFNSKDSDKLNRIENLERKLGGFFERLFTTKAQRDSILDWWGTNPLSKAIPLDIITQVVNSNAFATWSQHGITLYMANKATPIDLYHEAWHGFSQLFLTMDEKTALYNEIRKYPKWAEASYFDVEEALAEDYRNYTRDNTLFTGVLGKIFKKVRDFLRMLFGKVTGQDMMQLRDIAVVKDLFDKLYKGEILDLKPSIDNIMFTKLNRARTIENFSIDETDKAVKLIDNLLGLEIAYYNDKNSSTTGAVRVFSDVENRLKAYESVNKQIEYTIEYSIEQYEALLEKDPTNIEEQEKLKNNIDLLSRILDNYGNPELALSNKDKSSVVAFQMKKSRFKIIQEELLEDPSDLENTRVLQDYKGNVINPKNLARPETLMIISSVIKVEKDENGNVTEVLDVFGVPQLDDPGDVWNKLAKVLEGSFDYAEMYERLVKYSENYPEFLQIIDNLRNPGNLEVTDSLQFAIETNFFKDLKKPRIRHIQYNINKTILEKEKYDEEGRKVKDEVSSYDSVVTTASFDTHAVIKDWKANFITASIDINPYIKEDTDGNPILNTEKVINDFGDDRGVFIQSKAREFLEAFGVYMDRSSSELNTIFEDTLNVTTAFKLTLVFDTIKLVHQAAQSTDFNKVAAAEAFKKDPLTGLIKGLPKELREDEKQSNDIRSSIRILAELQTQYSDGYSNFSVLSPDGNRVWEQVVDNTITRVVTSINYAKTWQELTNDEADPNGKFKHMRWLSEDNNAYSKWSVLLNSVFFLEDILADNYGQKRKIKTGAEQEDIKLIVNNVGGTQLIVKNENDTVGKSTASLDGTSKFLQEVHTMLLGGIEEFMRHASKNTAMSLSTQELFTYPGKIDKHLYIDIDLFKPKNTGLGETEGFNIIVGYIAGELERINRYKDGFGNESKEYFAEFSGYNRPFIKKDGTTVAAGEVFTAFDDVLTESTKDLLYKVKGNLVDYLEDNLDLRQIVKNEVTSYFEKETAANLKTLQTSRFVDESLYEKGTQAGISKDQVDETLMKAYTYNSWIHKFETLILAYGDLVQYNHDKEEFHKRNAGLGSGGLGFRSDLQAISYINSSKFPRLYAKKYGYTVKKYDGTFTTGIIKEKIVKESVYYKEYLKKLTESITKRLGNKEEAEKLAKKTLEEYLNMKEADGQGYITLESYRMFKELEGDWSNNQELLYKKIVDGGTINVEDVIEFFPSYKLQYFGNIQTKGLALTSFHKFSLAPLIPGVTGMDTYQDKLHDKMMEKQMDYVVFETGSKVGHIGNGDVIVNEDGSFNEQVEFTKNVIFAEYLKNQTAINSKYKGDSLISTQLRKLILEGLYEKGVIDTTDEDKITEPRVRKYLNDVKEYSEILKVELLKEIGYEEKDGSYFPKDSSSTEKLAELIRTSLELDDVVGDHLIDFIDVLDDGTLRYDTSLHPEAAKIEKLIMSVINKKLIKQAINGEPLVQVSSALYAGAFQKPKNKLRLGSDEEIKKYAGSTVLPSYHEKADGFTAAMKVMIALQGDYSNLLNLKALDGEIIGNIDRLNEAIKDDAWLDSNNGANRKAITLVGVRIPVQSLNSMEYMEVFHFLSPQAGNLIVPPSEIVAKSGADFDIDKLTLYMANINADGTLPTRMFENVEELKEYLENNEVSEKDKAFGLDMQKMVLQNELMDSMRSILELPQNYVSLITPNGTFLLKELSEDLAKYVMEYDPFTNKSDERNNKSGDGKNKTVISPTRVLETLYNIYKHESNVVGKRTLGLGAVENTFHTLINSIETEGGVAMPDKFIHGSELKERDALLWLRHNKVTKNGKELISIASRYDVDNKIKISDVISQMINGWVDVEKDAWIFFIQGNYEVAPILLYLIKTGVPVKEAVYFVSQPLVREYVKEQRLATSTYADVLNKKPESKGLVKYQAASEVIDKYFDSKTATSLNDNRKRYEIGKNLTEAILEDRKNKSFTEKEMYKLIKDFKKDESNASSELSLAMFLHYIQIEQQITGLTQLKVAANPDTSTKSTGSEVEQSEANIEALLEESKLEPGLLNSIRLDSVIGSFFNNPLALAINSVIFPLRYNKAISNYLVARNKDVRADSAKTFGDNKSDVFVNTFRNDLISFLFQTAARRYTLGDTYKSYTLNTAVPVSLVDELKFGAFVKTDKAKNKTLYIDKAALENDFKRKVFVKGSELADSYEKRGLYTLTLDHFHFDGLTNQGEYVKFVAEREYLRSIYSKADVKKMTEYKAELKTVKEMNPTFSKEKIASYTYEKILANKALENTLNPYHMFKDPHYAYAIRFSQIMLKYGKDLKKNYSVLNKMKNEPNSDRTMFNLFVAEKDFTTDTSNLYTKNLNDLADPSVKKVQDVNDNEMISDFFSKLPLYTFMQTGINKTKFNFGNIVDYTQFMNLVNEEAGKLVKALEMPTLAENFLNAFYNRFIRENSRTKTDKSRYKNYLFGIDLDSLSKLASEPTNLEDRPGLIETKNPNIFMFDESKFAPSDYEKIITANTDVTFLYPTTVAVLQNKTAALGRGITRRYANDMSIGFPVSFNNENDHMLSLDPKNYKIITNVYDEAIKEITSLIESGYPVAIPMAGFGNSTSMPKELFVYLSKKLYQQPIGFLNPGSTMYKEMSEIVGNNQGISDKEILDSLGLTEDPFTCKL